MFKNMFWVFLYVFQSCIAFPPCRSGLQSCLTKILRILGLLIQNNKTINDSKEAVFFHSHVFYSGLSLKMQQELPAFRIRTHSENQQFHLWSFGKGLDMCQLQWSCFAFGHCWARPVDLELGAVSIYRWIASEAVLLCSKRLLLQTGTMRDRFLTSDWRHCQAWSKSTCGQFKEMKTWLL